MAAQIRRHGQVRRPNGSKEMPVRSVRVPDEVWEKAKMMADYEGMTISNVVARLVEGYAKGMIPLPQVVVTYGPAPRASEPSRMTG